MQRSLIKPRLHRLLIVSHVLHFQWEGRLFAYGPYAREIEVWADLFPEVVIASPLRLEAPPRDALALNRSNISVAPQLESGGDNLRAKAIQVLALPRHLWRLARAMRRADAIHVRCPGNLGLLGCLLAPCFSGRLVAKYAGQWNGYEGEGWGAWVQRAILRSRWWRGIVTVYGQWPDRPPHVIPFFTSMMTSEMVAEALRVAAGKRFSRPLKLLYVGRLVREKRVWALLEAVRLLLDRSVALSVRIVGGGPDERPLREKVARLDLAGAVAFTGPLPYEAGLKWMEWGECLVLPSEHSEGWPKALAEAMCYGLVCIGVRHGQVPAMLGGRGVLLDNGQPKQIADAVEWVATNSGQAQLLAQAGAKWAAKFSLDGLKEELANLLEREWQVVLRSRSAE